LIINLCSNIVFGFMFTNKVGVSQVFALL